MEILGEKYTVLGYSSGVGSRLGNGSGTGYAHGHGTRYGDGGSQEYNPVYDYVDHNLRGVVRSNGSTGESDNGRGFDDGSG